jgi:hypothetical protein
MYSMLERATHRDHTGPRMYSRPWKVMRSPAGFQLPPEARHSAVRACRAGLLPLDGLGLVGHGDADHPGRARGAHEGAEVQRAVRVVGLDERVDLGGHGAGSVHERLSLFDAEIPSTIHPLADLGVAGGERIALLGHGGQREVRGVEPDPLQDWGMLGPEAHLLDPLALLVVVQAVVVLVQAVVVVIVVVGHGASFRQTVHRSGSRSDRVFSGRRSHAHSFLDEVTVFR